MMRENDNTQNNLSFVKDGSEYLRSSEGIQLCRAADVEEVRILDSIEGEPVRWAAPYAFAGSSVKEVRFPRTMEKIGNYCFYRCFQLKKLSFTDALEDVGSGAFNGCTLEEIEIDFYRGEKSVLKYIVDEQRYALTVTLRFHEETGCRGEARLLFPEHYEEAVENTPARIVETHYHGSGGDYRQCFYSRELNFQEYDHLFPRAVAEESEETAVRLASFRLFTPRRLSSTAREQYETYLRSHILCAGQVFTAEEDLAMLRFYEEEKYWDRGGLEAAVDCAARLGKTEVMSLLLEERRRLFPRKKKVFEL